MTTRTVADEHRSGMRLIVVGSTLTVAMFALWWLIITTNSEGDPGDPYLLPLFGLIPLMLGIYRVRHARQRTPD